MVWASPGHVAEKSFYHIGVNLEFTGFWAEVAKTLKNAMGLEVERINATVLELTKSLVMPMIRSRLSMML